MRARNVGLGTMFGWIPSTFRLVTGNFGAMAVATILTLLLGLLVALPFMFYMFQSLSGLGSFGVPQPQTQDMTGFWIAYALTIVGSIALMPPLLAGWFRICASADGGAAISGTQVLSPYGDRETWVRLLVFVLLGTLMYAAFLGLMFLLFKGAFTELIAMQAGQEAAMRAGTPAPPPSPALLGKIFLMYVVLLPTMFVLQFVYMVGFAEVSLTRTSAIEAFQEAIGGVLRNLVKLLVFLFCVGMGAGVLMAIVMLVVGLLAAALSFISPVLMAVVLGLVYIVFLLLMYPLMFAGNYYVWKAMLGGDAAPATDAGAVAA